MDIGIQIFEEKEYWSDKLAKMTLEEKVNFLCEEFSIYKAKELADRLTKV